MSPLLATTAAVAFLTLATTAVQAQSDPFVDSVVAFAPGANAGFGANDLPDIVMGPPRGAGERQGSTDVVSLGHGGSITLHFDAPTICDGDGPDFTIFENAFLAGTLTFAELAFVEVSQDGLSFVDFPVDETTLAGSAGRTPVFSNPTNGIDPTDPTTSGGDAFDLADVGLRWIAYVRIVDAGDAIADPGNMIPPGTSAGFDLDAIAAIHTCPSEDPTPTTLPTTGPPATPTATPVPGRPGDVDGDGNVDPADIALLIAEIFDGDGKLASDSSGGGVSTPPSADAQGDGLITAADLVAVAQEL